MNRLKIELFLFIFIQTLFILQRLRNQYIYLILFMLVGTDVCVRVFYGTETKFRYITVLVQRYRQDPLI